MDRQLLIDKLLETENLTDNLEDNDANSLLDWGIAQVDELIKGIDDHDVAGEKINGLMHVMRGLNSLAADPHKLSHEAVADLVNRYSALIGKGMKVGEDERRSIVERVSNMQPGEAVRFLTDWLKTKK